MADWDEHNKLRIFYCVNYFKELKEKGFPEERLGYECMSIKDYDKETKKPIKMIGTFHHCVSDDGKPFFLGDVVYSRKV